MTHDPMCPMVTGKPAFHDDLADSDCLFCPLIARVREDEAVKREADGPYFKR